MKRNRIVLTDDKGKKVKISKQNFNYLMKKYRPDIKALDNYKDSKTKIKFLCLKHNEEFTTYAIDVLSYGVGCKECFSEKMRKIRRTNEEYIKAFEEKYPDYKVLEIKGKMPTKEIKVVLKCVHHPDKVWEQTAYDAMCRAECPYCRMENRMKEKSLAVLRPELIKYFKNKEDAYTHTEFSFKFVPMICPECGAERDFRISRLSQSGFVCLICSDNISYPNRFCRNLMLELNPEALEFEKFIKYGNEKHFFDCYFEVNSKSFVIEVDGSFHTQQTNLRRSLEEQLERDATKNKIAKENNWTMIRIPCPNNSYNELVEGFKNSIISNLFDLSKIDWKGIDIKSQKSLIKQVCDYFNEDPTRIPKDIGLYFKLNGGTINKYIKRGLQNGWINKEHARHFIERCAFNRIGRPLSLFLESGEKVRDFNNDFEAIDFFQKEYNIKLHRKRIDECITGERKSYKGFVFKKQILNIDYLYNIIMEE